MNREELDGRFIDAWCDFIVGSSFCAQFTESLIRPKRTQPTATTATFNLLQLGKRGKLLVIAVVDPQATITNAYIENMKALARKFNAQTKAKVKETSNGRVSSFVCSFVRLFVCSLVGCPLPRPAY